jgi:uncharacterized protein (TIGR04255 family)
MTVDSSQMPLPDYANPPVVETVLGVQFDRLPGLTNGHIGAFWLELNQREWPTIGDAPQLPNQFENFADSSGWARAVHFQLTQDPACRTQIRNADLNRMIQVQNSRLHFNWMKGEGGRYPHYDNVRKEFTTILGQFRRFVDAKELGEFKPNQWEVTYVNQIPRGTVWTTPADWGFFRPLGGVPTVDGLIEGESFTGEWHFVIPGQRGRLHIDWQHGKAPRGKGEEATGEDSVRLNLTARGPIVGNETGDSVMAGLDLGHETVVRVFACLMSDAANRYWEIANASNS